MPAEFSKAASSSLTELCLSRIAAGDDYSAYERALRAFVGSGQAQGLGMDDEPAALWKLVHSVGRGLWRTTPHPGHRFGPAPLPALERNSPCHCGSGRKYKQCCMAMDAALPLPQSIALAPILERVPVHRWAELPGSRVDPQQLATIAFEWQQQGRDAQVRALLEPWFVRDRDFQDKREALFDLLLDVYSAPGLESQKRTLLQRAVAHGERRLRSAALHRACTMAADQGDYGNAWELFRQAQRNEPDSPNLAHLEVMVLIFEGRGELACERARFWMRKLEWLRDDPGGQRLLQFLAAVVERGEEAIADSDETQTETALQLLQKLRSALQDAPRPQSLYRLSAADARGGSSLKLRPLPRLKAALASWRANFSDPDELDLEEELTTEALDAAAADWLQDLRDEPRLWNTFEVLDGLCRWIELLEVGIYEEDPDPEAVERETQSLLLILTGRAVALMQLVLPAPDSDQVSLPWRIKSNRRVLQLLNLAIRAHADDPDDAVRVALLNWGLKLDPSDSQGMSIQLSHALVARGDCDGVLALLAAFPQSRTELGFDAALVLFADGQQAAAERELLAVLPGNPIYALELLRPEDAEDEDEDSDEADGVDDADDADADSADEDELFDELEYELAEYYRADMRDLWVRSGALAWLREVVTEQVRLFEQKIPLPEKL